jgi:hypothetical protein
MRTRHLRLSDRFPLRLFAQWSQGSEIQSVRALGNILLWAISAGIRRPATSLSNTDWSYRLFTPLIHTGHTTREHDPTTPLCPQ